MVSEPQWPPTQKCIVYGLPNTSRTSAVIMSNSIIGATASVHPNAISAETTTSLLHTSVDVPILGAITCFRYPCRRSTIGWQRLMEAQHCLSPLKLISWGDDLSWWRAASTAMTRHYSTWHNQATGWGGTNLLKEGFLLRGFQGFHLSYHSLARTSPSNLGAGSSLQNYITLFTSNGSTATLWYIIPGTGRLDDSRAPQNHQLHRGVLFNQSWIPPHTALSPLWHRLWDSQKWTHGSSLLWLADVDAALATSRLFATGTLTPEAMAYFSTAHPVQCTGFSAGNQSQSSDLKLVALMGRSGCRDKLP